MKKIFSNAAVISTFVAQSQETGRNQGGSFHFVDNVAYSYFGGYVIARIVGRVALVAVRDSSVTTNKLNSALRVALSNAGYEIIEVVDVTCDSRHAFERNVDYLTEQAAASRAAAKRSRKYTEMLENDAKRFTEQRCLYISRFSNESWCALDAA